ncbi:MAG TPA: hypothetical protein VFU53_13360 [Burkholderiales bacterium]|nr:hypothetical protein [Burkholderiales bacterium]
MASRRSVAHLLLVLALLLAQQVLTAHPFVHRAAADPQDDQSAPAERVLCALCVVGAAVGSALPSTGHSPFVSAAQVFEPAPITWAHRPPLVRAFSARAPPTSL